VRAAGPPQGSRPPGGDASRSDAGGEPPRHAWLEQRERGTLLALRLITWITRRFGYGAGRALLGPICVYFIVFSGRARRASREYLARVLGRPPTWRDVFVHYHTFAASILDRVVFLTGSLEDFALDLHGAELVAEALERRKGLLLLGSHLGSFEIVRAIGATQPWLVVNVVMHEGNAGKIVAWLHEVAPDRAPNVIAPGRAGTMLQIRDALARNEVVAMLGDRPIGRSPTHAVPFLGAKARFPTGPLRIAHALDVPVLTFFGLCRGPRRYELRFEPLDHAGDAHGAIEKEVEAYAARLERYARSAPYNWFNFYPYWGGA
jgi:predicted LPLAT superfamily acyltransferase